MIDTRREPILKSSPENDEWSLRKSFEDDYDNTPLKWKPDYGPRKNFFKGKHLRGSFEDEHNSFGFRYDDNQGRRESFDDNLTLL